MNNYAFNKIKGSVTCHGVMGVAGKLWRKLATLLYCTSCSTWYLRDLQVPVMPFSPEIDVTIKFLVEDKLNLVRWLAENKGTYPWIYIENEIDVAMENKHIFLEMTHHEQIIGYIKVGRGRTYIHDFDRIVEFPPGTAFIYDTFTLPEYRGKSLALHALNSLIAYLKEYKYKQIVCHIEKWNIPSIRTFEKAGFHAFNSIMFVRIIRFTFFIRNRFVPFIELDSYLRDI